MNIFTDKLKEFLKTAGFWKTFGIKFIWNFGGRKVLLLIIALVFFCLDMIDQTALLIIMGYFIGANVLDKFKPEK